MLQLSVLATAVVLGFSQYASAVWPIPSAYAPGTEIVWLSHNLKVDIKLPKGDNSEKVRGAWERTRQQLFKDNIVPWKFFPKGTDFEPAFSRDLVLSKLVLTQLKPDDPKKLDERYNVTIPTSNGVFAPGSVRTEGGAVYIDAYSSHGLLHGLATLSQLFYAAADRQTFNHIYTNKAPLHIVDAPKFPHRGLNLDVARQWYPLDAIKKVIDALAWNKFNILHLHATDSQSWPLEIPAMPELAQKGSYRQGLTYSPRDLQSLLDYAEERGVKIIVEIDMPGHTTSIAESHPDLIVGRNIQPNWDTYAAQPPSGSLKLNNPDVEKFLSTLFKDLLPRLNKHSGYFHSGGDEVNKNVYALDPGVGSNEKEKIQPHLQKFFNHVAKDIKQQGLGQIVWEEMLLDWELKISKDTIIQTWQSPEAVFNATKAGYQVIVGDYTSWYLDCGHGQWLDFGPARFQQFFPFADYCSPRKSWRLMYSYDPVGKLSPEQAKFVRGGEIHVWSEQIDAENIEIVMWPRAAAAGEVLWSGRQDANGVNRTFADASQRLGEWRERMVKRGVKGSPVTQLWCHMNEGDCALN